MVSLPLSRFGHLIYSGVALSTKVGPGSALQVLSLSSYAGALGVFLGCAVEPNREWIAASNPQNYRDNYGGRVEATKRADDQTHSRLKAIDRAGVAAPEARETCAKRQVRLKKKISDLDTVGQLSRQVMRVLVESDCWVCLTRNSAR